MVSGRTRRGQIWGVGTNRVAVSAPDTDALAAFLLDEAVHFVDKGDVVVFVGLVVFIRADMDLLHFEPRQELLPDSLYCGDSLWMREIQQILLRQGELRLPFRKVERVTRGFDLRNDSNSAERAMLLEIFEICAGESLVLPRDEPLKLRVFRPQ